MQLAALKDSITASSTAEAQASLSQQVSSPQSHKRAVENLALLRGDHRRVQELMEEVSCVQTEVKDVAERLRKLCGNHEDVNRLKQQWSVIQVLMNVKGLLRALTVETASSKMGFISVSG